MRVTLPLQRSHQRVHYHLKQHMVSRILHGLVLISKWPLRWLLYLPIRNISPTSRSKLNGISILTSTPSVRKGHTNNLPTYIREVPFHTPQHHCRQLRKNRQLVLERQVLLQFLCLRQTSATIHLDHRVSGLALRDCLTPAILPPALWAVVCLGISIKLSLISIRMEVLSSSGLQGLLALSVTRWRSQVNYEMGRM